MYKIITWKYLQNIKRKKKKRKRTIRKERRAFSYHRSLPLPEKVDSAKAKAKMNNGILSVEIPKMTPIPSLKAKIFQFNNLFFYYLEISVNLFHKCG
jgi:hypothetical protein